MNLNWKSLSISLIISIIIHGIAGIYLLIKSKNELVSIIEKIISENSLNISENINVDKISITIAQGSGFSLEIMILIIVLSFILITSISYFVLNYLEKKYCK